MNPAKKRRQKNKTLEDVFQALNRDYVRMKERDRKRNNSVLFSVLPEILNIMKRCSKTFENMKPRLEYLGSYFDGLRVGTPTEYDINVVLKLPINYKKIVLDSTDTLHDYTVIKMPSEFRRLSKTPAMVEKGFKDTEMWCDKNFRLSVKKFRSWMQSVVDSAFETLPLVNGRRILVIKKNYYQLFTKMSGPANTVTIIVGSDENNVIDVDLVPSISFNVDKRPVSSRVVFDALAKDPAGRKEYFVVPKPTADEFSWRLAFPLQERDLLNDKSYFKSTLKLIKLLRDVQGFKKLASYYIKSIFLWETRTEDTEIWKAKSLSFLVLHMLKKVRDCLAKGQIFNFWCPEYNLIHDKISLDTCQKWSNRLSTIIVNVEQNARKKPDTVIKYFTKKNVKRVS